jgi:O-acetyl-ADP-ribose deacetylase (regulator of RNase III)
MPLIMERNDITKMKVDAIVNAANTSLLGGGGVDGAIHRAAGPQLLEECRTLHGCLTGQAKITKGYRLPCKYVIHTVGPIYQDGCHGEKEQLISCYRNSLALAAENDCTSVAFPLISSGVYGYPKDQALQVASDTIREFLNSHDMLVYLVIFDRSSVQLSRQLTHELKEYIDDHYVEENKQLDIRSIKSYSCQGNSAVEFRRVEDSDTELVNAEEIRRILWTSCIRSMRASRKCCCARLTKRA